MTETEALVSRRMLQAAWVLACVAWYGGVVLEQRILAGPAQNSRIPGAQTAPAGMAEIAVQPVQGRIYMLVGGSGANITVQIGDDGVLLVDAGPGTLSDKIVLAIRQLSDKPIRFIINTSADQDHTGGNETLAKHGRFIYDAGVGPGVAQEARIFAQQSVYERLSGLVGGGTPRPVGAWPTETFRSEGAELFFNNEPIQILAQPAAHTDGDSLVYFRYSDVISAGDIFLTTGYPVIKPESGGSINGLLDGLNRIIAITIPKFRQEGGTYVIPGHGRVADEADVVEYRDMLTIIRDRIHDLVNKGLSFEQVKAARPTHGYEARYGSKTGGWTTDMFIEGVYKELAQRKS